LIDVARVARGLAPNAGKSRNVSNDNPVGAWLAREGVVSFNIDID
jgi:hypothetical protein